MLIATVADLHIRGKDLAACRAQIDALAIELARRSIGHVCVAGDVFDTANVGDKYASTGAVASLTNEFFEHCGHVSVIHGQHDAPGHGVAPATMILAAWEHVAVSREPCVRRIYGDSGGDVRVCFVPWQWDGNADEIVSALIGGSTCDLLVAHCHVAGARLNGLAYTAHFHEPTDGAWDWSLSLDTLKRFRHVALGDFHCRQELVPGVGGYVGALRQCNFGEEGNPAGFEIWDSEANTTEWVDLDAAPKHKTWRVDADNPAPTEAETRGCRSRVIYTTEPDRGEAQRLAEAGVVIEREPDRIERIHRATVDATAPRDMIGQWAATQDPPFPPERIARMTTAFDRIMANATETERI